MNIQKIITLDVFFFKYQSSHGSNSYLLDHYTRRIHWSLVSIDPHLFHWMISCWFRVEVILLWLGVMPRLQSYWKPRAGGLNSNNADPMIGFGLFVVVSDYTLEHFAMELNRQGMKIYNKKILLKNFPSYFFTNLWQINLYILINIQFCFKKSDISKT